MSTSNEEIRIAVMGVTGSGKSTFINVASGSDLPVGRGLESCTSEVQISQPFVLDGRVVLLIDTPGFDDTTHSDIEILAMIAAYLSKTYEHGTRLAGVIYMHRISDTKMGNTSIRNFKIFRGICGEDPLKNVLIVTNMWNEVKGEVGEAREAELASKDQFFKPALDKGTRLLRHDGTLESAHTILRHLINSHPTTLHIQQEIVDEHKPIEQTVAGSELRSSLEEQAERNKEEIRNLRAELETAMQARNEETRNELQKALEKKQQEYLYTMEQNSEHMAAGFAAEYTRLEDRMLQMEDMYQKRLQTLTGVETLVTAARVLWESGEQGSLHGDKRQPRKFEGRKERALEGESHQKHYTRDPLEEMGWAHTDTTEKNHAMDQKHEEQKRLAASAGTRQQPTEAEARMQAKTSRRWLKITGPILGPIRPVCLLVFCCFMFQALQEDLSSPDRWHLYRTFFLCLFGFLW